MKQKIRLGYSNEYVHIEDVHKKNSDELIKERNIKCSFCGSELKPQEYIVLVHTPGDSSKPKRLHFFCKSKKCHMDWAMQSQSKRES